MERVWSLYDNTLDGLKVGQLNEKITYNVNYKYYHFCFIAIKLFNL